MQNAAERSGRIPSPTMGLLQLEMCVNATDKELIENLEATKARNLPELGLFGEHKETLVIVGSGPSLKDTWKFIPPKSEVLALNGAYKFLRSKGMTPDYFAMLDSRAVNTNFLDNIDTVNTAYFIASQCHPDVFNVLKDATVYVFHLGTPTTRLVFPDKDVYLGGGGTIGLSALGLAIALGYRSVVLFGYDSSFSGDSRHVEYQLQNEGLKTLDVWVEDRKYTTTHAMAAQAMDFFPYYDAIRREYPGFTIDLVGSGLFYDFIVTNNNPPSRERELSKYVEAYKHDEYGMTEERRDGLDNLIGKLAGSSYLDISTGRGEVLELADKHGFKEVRGTETVPQLLNDRVAEAILPNIPHPDKSFDCVSLIEVIEHLLPEDVKPALLELTRIARLSILISAAVQECWLGGVNLHPSARPEEEWDKLFHEVWGDQVYRVGNLGGSPAWRVDLSVAS